MLFNILLNIIILSMKSFPLFDQYSKLYNFSHKFDVWDSQKIEGNDQDLWWHYKLCHYQSNIENQSFITVVSCNLEDEFVSDLEVVLKWEIFNNIIVRTYWLIKYFCKITRKIIRFKITKSKSIFVFFKTVTHPKRQFWQTL